MKGAPDILTTPRLILRPFEKDDAGNLAGLLDNFEIYMNTTCIPFPYTLEDAESFISRRQEFFNADRSATWAVTEADGSRLVGGISLELDLPAQKAEIGYWTGIPWWNMGYCTEAAVAVLGFAFGNLGLNLVEARHFTRNPSSGRVLVKIGMIREAVLRQRSCKDGVFLDMAVYSILADEHSH